MDDLAAAAKSADGAWVILSFVGVTRIAVPARPDGPAGMLRMARHD